MTDRVFRVALPGYDALSDTNPDHYSIFTGSGANDPVLIKEKVRGSISVNASSSYTITHGLGYVPFFAVYANGELITGYNIYSKYLVYATTTTLVLRNNDVSARTFYYYIFFDQQV